MISVKQRAVIFALTATSLIAAQPAAAQSDLVAILVPGNPNCAALNLNTWNVPNFSAIRSDFGFKFDNVGPSLAGTTWSSPLVAPSGSNLALTAAQLADPNQSISVIFAPGNIQYFSWTSTLPIDAIIVKGGNQGALVYIGAGELTAGTAYHPPHNVNGQGVIGDIANISHIEFCYDYEVAVSKTAETDYTRTYSWEISKSVDQPILHMFKGDSRTVNYAVTATRNQEDSDFEVSGVITIANNSPYAAAIGSVTDVIDSTITAQVDCGGVTSVPARTPSGPSAISCTYSAPLLDKTTRVNVATVNTTATSVVGGGAGSADVVFGEPTRFAGMPDSVMVDDSNGSSWSFEGTGTQNYSRTLACNANAGLIENTARIRDTQLSASASVNVNCYELSVAKTAATSFQRNFTWTINKSTTNTNPTLAIGQSLTQAYTVNVGGSFNDSLHTVSGTITVANPAPMVATLTGVSDVLIGAGPVNVNCGVEFPYALGAEPLQCTYSVLVADKTSRTNTAMATILNNDGDNTSFTGTAQAVFGTAPTTTVNPCVDVHDAFNGGAPVLLGNVCNSSNTSLTQQFTYTQVIGPFETAGTRTFPNTASLSTGGSSSVTVNVNVPAPSAGGCTRTIGYWKTMPHRAHLEQRFVGITLGNTQVLSVNQAVTILSSTGSNGIDKLRAQLLATKLNIANGASSASVATAIAQADALLAQYAPSAWSLSSTPKQQILGLMTIFDNYNNGLLGPTHCQ